MSNFDQCVTQWMSVVRVVIGNALNAAQSNVDNAKPSVTVASQSSASMCSVRPAVRTGKSSVTNYPGGVRSSVARALPVKLCVAMLHPFNVVEGAPDPGSVGLS